jgi:hypothetical protein
MSKRSSKSGYRAPTRSEKILAVIGLLVIISMVLSALALSDGPVPVQPTSIPATSIFITVAPEEPTTELTDSGPALPTPGQAPAPGTP